MMPPNDPPFSQGTIFPDSEWSRFFRVFSITTAMSATVLVGTSMFKISDSKDKMTQVLGAALPSGASLAAICSFGLCALVYCFVARIFEIHVTFRQAMFCFALVITPSVPFFLLVKVCGASLGLVWFLIIWGLPVYELFLIVKAIQIVSGASSRRVTFSLLPMIALAIIAMIS
jgi:hypothetical protein